MSIGWTGNEAVHGEEEDGDGLPERRGRVLVVGVDGSAAASAALRWAAREARPGRQSNSGKLISELVAFIEAREPQLLPYGFYFDEDEQQMTVVAVHPDSASLDLHLQVGDSAFRGFADVIDLQRIEVFRDPGSAAMERLRSKAEQLGERGEANVHLPHGGFTRFGAVTGSGA